MGIRGLINKHRRAFILGGIVRNSTVIHRFPRRRRSLTLAAALLFLAPMVVHAQTAPSVRGATPAQINADLKKAVDYLYAHQQPAGNWEFTGPDRNYTGRTALAIYALLAAGERPTNEHLAKAIRFLEDTPTVGTYAVGVRSQVWPYLKQTADLHRIELNEAKVLLSSVGTKGEASGLWYYTAPNTGTYDHSVSQFGVLGLWALQQNGVEVPGGLWERSDESWRRHQLPDGSWCYCNTGAAAGYQQSTTTMTAAGVATLFITSDCIRQQSSARDSVDPNIESGLKWLGDHFGLFFANGIQNEVTQWYGIYGLERIGVASGRKYLGTHNWFAEGSDWLMRMQKPDGSWGAPSNLWGFNQQNVVDTSFAILFLARGRAPVIMEKVQYNVTKDGKAFPGHWNHFPRDLAHFSQWMGTQLEQDLNWQVTSLDAPDADLHDAPILYISGDQALDFSDTEIAKLRRFVEEGGMILGNADSQSMAFAKSFRELGAKLFPRYEFRQLPESHPIYTNEEFRAVKWKARPRVEGMSNGVRELLLLPATDLSRVFQSGRNTTGAESYELADDIVLYSVDTRGLAQKGETCSVAEDAKVPVTRTVRVARLQYDGNWDPEPGGWRRLAAVFHNSLKIALQVDTVKLGDGNLTMPPVVAEGARPTEKAIRQMAIKRIPPADVSAAMLEGADKAEALISAKVQEIHKELDAAEAARAAGSINYAVAHLTGADAIKLTDAQRQELKKYVDAGGTLIIDAAGGSTTFAASAEQTLRSAFGSDAAQIESPLLPECPIYHLPGHVTGKVDYRQFARSRISNATMPQLRGVTIGGRLAVIFSREDLSAGLVGEPVDGVTGYSPASAAELMTDVILATAKIPTAEEAGATPPR